MRVYTDQEWARKVIRQWEADYDYSVNQHIAVEKILRLNAELGEASIAIEDSAKNKQNHETL